MQATPPPGDPSPAPEQMQRRTKTALDRYARLEALGAWREAEGAAPREVVVGFGETTLVLTDTSERPLGHWALAGVQAIGRDGAAQVYAMSETGGETLTIRDPDMIEAIGAVTRAHRPRPGASGPERSGRGWTAYLTAAIVLAGLVALAPDLLRGQAARMMPPEAAEEFGDQMLLQIMAARGPLCAEPTGRRALADLAGQVSHGETARLRALDLGPTPIGVLPGPTVLLGRVALSHSEDPAEIAGWLALALAREELRPGPERLMAAVGPVANLRYIFTGRISEAALARASQAALGPPSAEEIDAAFARLREAGLATGPFADGLRRAGIEAPLATDDGAPALDPQDWAALKGLCQA